MSRRAAFAPLVTLAPAMAAIAALGACSTILGYDGLTARDDTPVIDTSTPIDTAEEVADVADDSGSGFHPRPRPPGDPKPSGKGKTLWLQTKQVMFGTLDATGKDSSDAWKDIGFDLDGTCTGPAESAGDIGTCKKAPGAEADALVDGNSCRDNNFAGKLMQQVKFARFEETTNKSVLAGNNAWILVLDDLDDGEDDPYVPARLYKAALWPGFSTGGPPPKFDGTDIRKVTADSLVDGISVNKPKTTFPKGYLSKNVWVSGEPAKLDLTLPLDSTNLTMPLTAGLMSVGIAPDHKTGGQGVITGAIPIALAKPLLDPIAKSIGVCPGSPFYDALLNTVQKYVDVVIESPTLQDPTVTCNGMSIGIGFVVAPIQPVTSSIDEPPNAVDKCKD